MDRTEEHVKKVIELEMEFNKTKKDNRTNTKKRSNDIVDTLYENHIKKYLKADKADFEFINQFAKYVSGYDIGNDIPVGSMSGVINFTIDNILPKPEFIDLLYSLEYVLDNANNDGDLVDLKMCADLIKFNLHELCDSKNYDINPDILLGDKFKDVINVLFDDDNVDMIPYELTTIKLELGVIYTLYFFFDKHLEKYTGLINIGTLIQNYLSCVSPRMYYIIDQYLIELLDDLDKFKLGDEKFNSIKPIIANRYSRIIELFKWFGWELIRDYDPSHKLEVIRIDESNIVISTGYKCITYINTEDNNA